MGAAGGLPAGGAMAERSADRRQPVAGADPGAQPAGDRAAGARRDRTGAASARARDHRAHLHGGQRAHAVEPAPAEGARRAHRDGRFRHRLLVAQLSAPLPVRQDQGRSHLRLGPRRGHRARRHRAGGRQHRPGARNDHHRGRRRNRLPARISHGARLRRGAGLSVLAGGPDRARSPSSLRNGTARPRSQRSAARLAKRDVRRRRERRRRRS